MANEIVHCASTSRERKAGVSINNISNKVKILFVPSRLRRPEGYPEKPLYR